MPDEFQGKPAKSDESIRASLESMQQGYRSDTRAGPRPHGAEPTDPIDIASFYDVAACKRFQQSLSMAGIPSTKASRRGQMSVSVDYEDRQRAVEILVSQSERFADQRPRGIRRDFDFLILGSVIGASTGFLVFLSATNRPAALVRVATLLLSGALIGHCIDRLVLSRRKFGRLRMGVREYLLFSVVCALLLSLRRLL